MKMMMNNINFELDEFEYYSKNIDTFQSFVSTFTKWFKNQKKFPFIFLKGVVGAGKTYFSKCFFSNLLSIPIDNINSPTYQYLNLYSKKHIHFDLYRITDKEALNQIAIDEYLTNEYIGCIEWPELLIKTTIITVPYILIEVIIRQRDERIIKIKKYQAI